jgi:hypothetical protein
MIVPRGKPVHENLSTSYVNVAALLADLQVNEFTGYVSVGFWNYDGYIFLSHGQIINAWESADGNVKREREALDGVLTRSQARSGAVGFYQHPDAVILAIGGIIDGEAVHRDLASDFTNLEKLVDRLCKATEAAWYVEVQLDRSFGGGIIYIVGGKAEGVASIRENENSDTHRTAIGKDGLALIYEKTAAIGGIFNVYKSVDAEAPPTPVAPPPTAVAPPAVLPPAPVTPFPTPLRDVSADRGPDRETEAPPTQRNPEVRVTGYATPTTPMEPVVDTVLVEDSEEDSPLELDEDGATSLTQEQYSQLIGLMGEVVAAVENGAVETTRRQDFSMSFREALIRMAEHYPFLDPFAAEFEYAGGEVTFRGKARPADFVVGLAQALRLTVLDLDKRLPETGVRPKVETALRELRLRRKADFERYGLEIATNEILNQKSGADLS